MSARGPPIGRPAAPHSAGGSLLAYTGDTADPDKEKAHLRFSTEVFPQAHEQGVRLSKRLLELDYSRAGLETTVQRFRTDAEIFRAENVALFAELEELSAQYQKIVGGLTVQWVIDSSRRVAFLVAGHSIVQQPAIFPVGASHPTFNL